ncbi:MAG: caspase family protein [Oscillochloridaceae bacterium umkhey_bin13]
MQGFSFGYALVVGVGTYQDARLNVPAAAHDAAVLATTLRDPQTAAYPGHQVQQVLDAEATLPVVQAALARLADQTNPESVVLISFTCHGAMGDDDFYYLATHETQMDPTGKIVGGTGLSAADLGRALRALRARRVLILLNACFAGTLSTVMTKGGIPTPTMPVFGQLLPDSVGNQLVTSGEGRAIIAAGRPDQRSYVLNDEGHSLFGRALINALQHGRGAAIGLFDLYDQIYREVSGAAARRLNITQEPTLTLLQGVGTFPVAASRGSLGDGSVVQQRPLGPIREVPPVINITQKSSVISFDGATIMGDVRTGHVVQGDATFIGGRSTDPEHEADVHDPGRRLALLRARVEVARNVDEDQRDDAVNKLKQAERALAQGDESKAHQRLSDALAILHTLDNGYLNSVTRKLDSLALTLKPR